MAKGKKTGGRIPGSRNKATMEREQKALLELQEKARSAPLRKLSKDKLYELGDLALGVVARYQRAALAADETGVEGTPLTRPKLWEGLMQSMELARRVLDSAADYESPKYRAVAVAMSNPDPAPAAQEPKTIENLPKDEHDRERVANSAYLRLVKS